MDLATFMQQLTAFQSETAFNPWADYDPACDCSPQAPEIRRQQLLAYLQPRLKKARLLLMAEAAGYQGCRFTGIPITCERMLLGYHKQITPELIIGQPGQRTSRPDSPYLTNAPQREKGLNEPTDTYVWGALVDNQLPPQDVLLWNIFPFHPHKKSPFTNRTPSDSELQTGLKLALSLLSFCRPDIEIAAIGRKAALTLEKAQISCTALRHPANGGANLFRQQFVALAMNFFCK